jgi:hypothetical protein
VQRQEAPTVRPPCGHRRRKGRRWPFGSQGLESGLAGRQGQDRDDRSESESADRMSALVASNPSSVSIAAVLTRL